MSAKIFANPALETGSNVDLTSKSPKLGDDFAVAFAAVLIRVYTIALNCVCCPV